MKNMSPCSLCKQPSPTIFQSLFLDGGWSFNWVTLGHYSGFTDSIITTEEASNEEDFMVHMCHDCCVKMLDTFPALKEIARVRGGHPNMNDHDSQNGTATPPCCPYAWTWVKTSSEYPNEYKTYFSTDELTWEERPELND
jgi:hypothetical protein